jgi:subtilisin family serine protease
VAAASSDQLIVVFKPGTTPRERATTRRAARSAVIRPLGDKRFQLVQPDGAQSQAAAIASLKRDPSVMSAEPDRTVALAAVPNDPLFGQLWGLQNLGQNVGGVTGAVAGADIDAVLAWDRTVGDPAVVVADIDTGYRFDDPDLGPVAWTNPGETAGDGIDNDNNGYVDDVHGWDAVGQQLLEGDPAVPDNDPTDPRFVDSGHGVHTAGTIGAHGNDGIGVTGVAQNVRIMPFRACGFNNECALSAITEGINYAGHNGARVANMSLSGDVRSASVEAALGANPQVLYVAAAGNEARNADGSGTPPMPCAINPSLPDVATGYTPAAGAIDNVLCVAATDQADALASFSNYGAKSVDLAAPGTEILSTLPALPDTDHLTYAWSFGNGEFNQWTTPSPPATAPDQGFELTPPNNTTIWSNPGTQAPDTTRATQSPPIDLPSGVPGCLLQVGTFMLMSGDDRFTWEVLIDGNTAVKKIETGPVNASRLLDSSFPVPQTSGTHTLALRLAFHRGAAGADGAGVEFTSGNLFCGNTGYDRLQGTSQATAAASGTAALLFSLRPQSTVGQVRTALLAGVDKLRSLSKKTVTGGRLNAWNALSALVPMDTRITSGPNAGAVTGTSVAFTFDTNNTGNASFECSLDSSAYQPCTSPKAYAGLAAGSHTFRVRSVVTGGVDASPATRTWKVQRK